MTFIISQIEADDKLCYNSAMERIVDRVVVEKKGITAVGMIEAIVAANFAQNRNLDSNISEINLGSFGIEYGLAIDLTEHDPEDREVGKLITVSRSGMVMVHKDFTRGKKTSVTITDTLGVRDHYRLPDFVGDYEVPDNTVLYENYLSQVDSESLNRGSLLFVASVLHSHPHPLPPFGDLAQLLLNDQASPFIQMVATKYDRYAVFRGANTPDMSFKEAKRVINKYLKIVQDLAGSSDFKLISHEALQLIVIDQIVKDFDFQFFHGDRFDTTLKRKAPIDLLKV